MNWHNLSNKKKANFLVLGAALVFLLFVLSIALLNSKNNALSQQLIEERALSNSLKILQSSVIFPTLSTAKAKNIIRKTYRAIQSKKIRTDKGKQIVFTGSKIPFFKLLKGLSALKSKYGIVVINADIKYKDNGVVDATMTFSHP
ncbi:hypothetical protein [uncultured Gammaproteobacteria bacterium]|jgi:type II secretory pathway component PulM|nr:hypothetical protein [uncultured Gammaproteobacteria bacterium]CAC9577315.1 hypothetical protein [uncultured Gammaproteobacteria bacterium]CAC9581976.1 hypothetical protein [uncultured Gammaproteobacteria bacterium]CAC9592947.1 hypothetical protein [uncultured Gammaproteobacteria bacterium]